MILPNFNHGHYLEAAILALLQQQPSPFEVVVIDDASTDNSRELIGELASRFTSLKPILNARNAGVSSALQQGLEVCRGKYVYCAAADDLVLPNLFRTALEAFAAYPAAGLVCAEAAVFDGTSGQSLGYRPAVSPLYQPGFVTPADTRRLLRRADNWIYTGATVFRRDALLRAGGFEPSLGAFADGFVARKIALIDGFAYVPRTVLKTRFFKHSVSGSLATDQNRARTAAQQIQARLASDPVFPEWYPELFGRRWYFATCRLAATSIPPDFGFIRNMGARSDRSRAALELLWRLTPRAVAGPVILAWLWVEWRPYRLVDLTATFVARLLRRAGIGGRSAAGREAGLMGRSDSTEVIN